MSSTESFSGTIALRAVATMVLCLAAFVAGPARSGAAEVNPFFGVVSQKSMTSADFDTMKWGRLGSFRLPVHWGAVQPSEEGSMTWGWADPMVAAAATHGIDVLPTLYGVPTWLYGDQRRMPIMNSRQIVLWKAFMRSAVLRYGRDGIFWQAHPELPYRPVTKWQIWNEPNIINFAKPVSPRRYAKLLRISSATIRLADPDAKIVTAGFYAKPPRGKGMVVSKYVNRLYRLPGFRSSFDIAAIHPYASTTGQSVRRTFPLRRSLNRHRDRRKHIVITELGWGSDSATAFGKGTVEAQGIQLASAYRKFLGYRRKLKLDSIYWFSWSDLPDSIRACVFCFRTGLFDNAGEPKPAWYRLLDFTHGI